MEMLDPVSPVPLYQQLKIALRRLIEAGEWQAGEAIPPERELIDRYGVSRITVRQALSDLEAEGLLLRRHGKGTFVAPRRAGVIAETLAELTGHVEELHLQGLAPDVDVLERSRGALPAEIAAMLGRPPEAEGWHVRRRVRVGDAPLMLSDLWLPADLGLDLTDGQIASMPMSRLLEQHGLFPVRGAQRIGAEVAGKADAGLLGIHPGEALLRVQRVIYGAGDQPLVWFRTLYRADRYEYEVELKRRR